MSRPFATSKYDATNLEAADLILKNIERHGGETALAVRWAHALLAQEAAEGAKVAA